MNEEKQGNPEWENLNSICYFEFSCSGFLHFSSFTKKEGILKIFQLFFTPILIHTSAHTQVQLHGYF